VEGFVRVMVEETRTDPASAYARAARASVDGAYRLAGYLLGSEAEAEDAVQDALVKAWRNWSSLRDVDRFGPWFDRILVNVCRDRMRLRRTSRIVDLDEANQIETRDTFARMVEDDEVARAIARLSTDHRIVIALRFWRDMTLEDVAVALDLPLGTVKSRLHYALKALRAELRRKTHEA
jgi:RNA polymerase sigma-70 factor, ECF subfamily